MVCYKDHIKRQGIRGGLHRESVRLTKELKCDEYARVVLVQDKPRVSERSKIRRSRGQASRRGCRAEGEMFIMPATPPSHPEGVQRYGR